MNKIKFNNGKTFDIKDSAELSEIVIISDEAEFASVLKELHDTSNFEHIQFIENNGVISGEYWNMALRDNCEVDADYNVIFGITEKSAEPVDAEMITVAKIMMGMEVE